MSPLNPTSVTNLSCHWALAREREGTHELQTGRSCFLSLVPASPWLCLLDSAVWFAPIFSELKHITTALRHEFLIRYICLKHVDKCFNACACTSFDNHFSMVMILSIALSSGISRTIFLKVNFTLFSSTSSPSIYLAAAFQNDYHLHNTILYVLMYLCMACIFQKLLLS